MDSKKKTNLLRPGYSQTVHFDWCEIQLTTVFGRLRCHTVLCSCTLAAQDDDCAVAVDWRHCRLAWRPTAPAVEVDDICCRMNFLNCSSKTVNKWLINVLTALASNDIYVSCIWNLICLKQETVDILTSCEILWATPRSAPKIFNFEFDLRPPINTIYDRVA